jgi:hypothetical protein
MKIDARKMAIMNPKKEQRYFKESVSLNNPVMTIPIRYAVPSRAGKRRL